MIEGAILDAVYFNIREDTLSGPLALPTWRFDSKTETISMKLECTPGETLNDAILPDEECTELKQDEKNEFRVFALSISELAMKLSFIRGGILVDFLFKYFIAFQKDLDLDV